MRDNSFEQLNETQMLQIGQLIAKHASEGKLRLEDAGLILQFAA